MLNRSITEYTNRDQLEIVSTDMLVPEDHLLRLIDKHIDFSFIYEKVKPFYTATTGRPPIDPVRLFKMMLLGYLFNIPSERQLEKEIITNVAYRWFLGLGLQDSVPDHSTISWNRTNRFKGSHVFQEVFDEVVHLAIHHRMIGGRLLITDSTHIQANANKNKGSMQVVETTPHEYLKELEQAVNENREAHDQKYLPPPSEKTEKKTSRVSTTDPESGYMMRKGKPEGFYYLDHRTVDHKWNMITDVFVTPGNVNDSTVYIERLQRQIDTFGFQNTLESVALDSGYMTPYVCKKTLEMNIFPVIAERSAPTSEGTLPKKDFTYDSKRDVYICPAGKELKYTTTNRAGYAEYKSDSSTCIGCPLRESCFHENTNQRKIQRHVWEAFKEKVMENRMSESGETVYTYRSQTIERSFADAKEHHGLRRSRFRGIEKVKEQVLMTAIAQNLKKMARYLASN